MIQAVERYLQKIQLLIPAGKQTKAYLRRTLDRHIASISSDTSMGVVPPSMLSATQVYASARMAVELIEYPDELAAKPEGIVDLGVIEWLLRPALLLKDGLFEPVASGPWVGLAPNIVQTTAKSVCRLDLSMDGYTSIHIGTGFVVGQDGDGRFIVMTNAHVVEEAVRRGWPSVTGLKFACDFARYTTSAGGQLLRLANEYQIHPHYDLALVYLPAKHFEETKTPPIPLAVSASPPDPLEGGRIGVVGHPSFNSNLDPFPKYFGFGKQFGVKRFSPGHIRVVEKRSWQGHKVDVFLHDATTLSGSSGSCILDLSSMKIVGLHFGGWPMLKKVVQTGGKDLLAKLFHANGAVPLWLLRDDPFLDDVLFA